MGESSDAKGKKKQEPDISKLWKATPTRIPDIDEHITVIPHQQEAKLPPTDWRFLLGFAGIIFVVIFILYAYSLNGQPLFNDPLNLRAFKRSYGVSVFWAQQVTNVLSSPLAQPWLKLTFGLDAISFPEIPAWYHLVNVVLHGTACIYFYLFVLQIGLRLKAEKRSVNNAYVVALFSTLLFACHPLASGAVAYISGRGPVLASCNYFLCLNLFLLGFYAQKTWKIVSCYLFGLIFLFIGISCNFQMLSLPVLMFAIALILKPGDIDFKDWFRDRYQDFGSIALYLVAAVITTLTGRVNLLDNGVDLMQMAPSAYIASCCKSFITYFLRCFVVPAGLSIEPPFTIAQSFLDPVSILGALILIGGASSVIWLKRKPMLAIALSIATMPFIADLIFVQHEFVSDQKFYIALSGVSLALISFAFDQFKLQEQVRSKKFIAGCAGVLLVLSGLTVWREIFWLDNSHVWTAKTEDMSPRAQAEYGRVRLAAGALDETEKIELEVLQKDPDCPNAHEVLGQLYAVRKKFDKAANEFQLSTESCEPRKTALERRASYQEQLAKTCLDMHDFVRAQKVVTPALVVYPGSATLHMYYGQSLLGQNQYLNALQELQTAYTLEPNNPWLLEPLVEAMLDVGGPQYTRAAYSLAHRALSVIMSSKVKLLFARAAIDVGRVVQAIPKLQVVLHEEPKNAEAMYLMSIATHLAGNDQMAQDWKKKALAEDPNIEKTVVMHIEPPTAPKAAPAGTVPSKPSTAPTSTASSTSTSTSTATGTPETQKSP